MDVYIAHSSNYDFINELYNPVKEIKFRPHDINFIFPHLTDQFKNSKQLISKQIDLLIAEVSYPSTGLGIELGWANIANVPIYCIHKTDMKYSSSLNTITDKFYNYSNTEELKHIIKTIIDSRETK